MLKSMKIKKTLIVGFCLTIAVVLVIISITFGVMVNHGH